MISGGSSWSPQPSRRGLVAVVAVAVVLRVLSAALFLRHPLSAVIPEDTEAYRTLARAIADGDWTHPAFSYLSPLYAFLLVPFAGLPDGAGRLGIVALQVAMDGASVALLYWIGARWLGPAPGLAAAALYAIYGIAIYYSAVVLPVTVLILLMLALLATALAVRLRPAAWQILPGAVLGLLALARPNALVLLPVLLLRGGSFTRGGWMLAGLSLVLAPFAVRSMAAGAGPSPFPVNGGINFYMGNHAEADGMYVSVPGVSDLPLEQVTTSIREASRRAGRDLDARAASRYWFGAGLEFLRGNPRAGARLVLKKTAMLVRAEEIPLNTNYAFARARLWILRPTIGYGLVLPLSVAGAVALLLSERRRDPDVWLLILVPCAYAASVIAFFVADRYRLPIVPWLCLLGGQGLTTIAGGLRTRRGATVAAAGALAAMAANAPLAAFTYPEYAKDYFQLGKVHRERGEMEPAVALHRRAAALMPGEAEPLIELAHTCHLAGRPFDAEMALRTALRIDGTSSAARRNLALLYRDLGLFAEAMALAVDETQRASIAQAREEVVRRSPDAAAFARAQYNVGVGFYGERRLAEARYAFKRSLAADPSSDQTQFALALVSRDLRLDDEACAAIRQAATLQPGDPEYTREQAVLCRGSR